MMVGGVGAQGRHNHAAPTQAVRALPLLFSYRRCPYAMRARMALLSAGRPFLIHELANLRAKPASLLDLSPKGTVPVLCLPDGSVLDQSWDIMAWAWQAGDPDGWWHRTQTPENLTLLELNDGAFKQTLDRYKYPNRFPAEPRSRDELHASAVATLLVPLEARLQSNTYLGGHTPCATDLAVFPFVRQFAAVDPDGFARQPLPALQAWLSGWLSSGLFEACMVKVAPGIETVFPTLDNPDQPGSHSA